MSDFILPYISSST